MTMYSVKESRLSVIDFKALCTNVGRTRCVYRYNWNTPLIPTIDHYNLQYVAQSKCDPKYLSRYLLIASIVSYANGSDLRIVHYEPNSITLLHQLLLLCIPAFPQSQLG